MDSTRRTLLLALPATLVAGRALAHHGWTRFDATKPLYLEGIATTVRWQNPHVEVLLDVPQDLQLPADLGKRVVPAQQARVDAAAILGGATLPARRGEWTCELAPLTRISAWNVPRLEPGARLALVGYTFGGGRDERVLRAEFAFVDGRAYPLRSLPA